MAFMKTMVAKVKGYLASKGDELLVLDNDEHFSDCELLVYASGTEAEFLRDYVRQQQGGANAND